MPALQYKLVNFGQETIGCSTLSGLVFEGPPPPGGFGADGPIISREFEPLLYDSATTRPANCQFKTLNPKS